MSTKRKALPCWPGCIFHEQPVLRYASLPSQALALISQLSLVRDYSGMWHQSLISLLVKFPTLSFKDFYIHFIRKKYKHDNSRNVYHICTLNHALSQTICLPYPALPAYLFPKHSLSQSPDQKIKAQCKSKQRKEEIPVCLKGKLRYLTLFDTYFFSKKLPFQQAAEDSI